MTEKKCSRCKEVKPALSFYLDRLKLSSHCKACKKIYYTSPKAVEACKLRGRIARSKMSKEQKQAIGG